MIMTNLLKVEMIVIAIVFVILVFRAVNRRQLQLKYSLVWLILSFGMILIAIFPQIMDWISVAMGIQTTSNFVYLIGIVLLLIILFFVTIMLSKQSERIRLLVQTVSIDKYLQESKINQINEGSKKC